MVKENEVDIGILAIEKSDIDDKVDLPKGIKDYGSCYISRLNVLIKKNSLHLKNTQINKSKIDIHDLTNVPVISRMYENFEVTKLMFKYLKNIVCECDNMETIFELVKADCGISVIPSIVFENPNVSDIFDQYEFESSMPITDFRIIVKNSRKLNKEEVEFIEYLQNNRKG
jgi:DNA-binding transcriptional LysR family regulator